MKKMYKTLNQYILADNHEIKCHHEFDPSHPFGESGDNEEGNEDNIEDDDDDIPGIFGLPDGEITLHDNRTVQLKILPPIAHPREALDRLEGCSDIRDRMDELIALSAYNLRMYDIFPRGKTHAVSLHSVFLGNPGTGKTTVCKIFGSLLREAGVLSKGHVVVCDRSSFLGTVWGDEERAVEQVVEQARGGVLMIDEAYLLNGDNKNDPARLVLPQLMTLLADEERRDIAVVLCGYKEPMDRMLETNPGLLSRFPNRFDFPDFSLEQLKDITLSKVAEYRYVFTPAAWDKYCRQLAEAYRLRDKRTWGNARYVANLLERIYVRHATRCMKDSVEGEEQLLQLTEDDILPLEVPRTSRRIGF